MASQAVVQLSPAQRRVLELLRRALPVGSIFRVWGGVGRGKTTVLQEVHNETGGAFLGMQDCVAASTLRHPLALEEPLFSLVLEALKARPVVILDDLHLIVLFSAGCHFYPRLGYLNAAIAALCTYALEMDRKVRQIAYDLSGKGQRCHFKPG